MKCNIGPWQYAVRIVPELFDDEDGKRLWGLADAGRRTIFLSADLPPDNRLDVLMHEVTHAWMFHFPRARTDEELADFTASIVASAHRDLLDAGGVSALLELRVDQEETPAAPVADPVADPDEPIDSIGDSPVDESGPRYVPVVCVEPFETTAMASGDRAQCGICETLVAGGSIVTSAARHDPYLKGRVVDRAIYCPHCNHWQTWVEGVNPMDIPNGSVAAGPNYTRGDQVYEFLRRHRQAVGLLV